MIEEPSILGLCVHLSFCEVENKTLLSHQARRGVRAFPADDLVADLYHQTIDALGALGLERYEISNFARPGFESRHNGKYWADAPFLGFGMSAQAIVRAGGGGTSRPTAATAAPRRRQAPKP